MNRCELPPSHTCLPEPFAVFAFVAGGGAEGAHPEVVLGQDANHRLGLGAHEVLHLQLVVAVPARAPVLDPGGVVGDHFPVGALVGGRGEFGGVGSEGPQLRVALGQRAQRVHHDGQPGVA